MKKNYFKIKLKFYFLFIIFLFIIFIFSFSKNTFAAYPKLITTLTSAFESIENWLIRISTPAAAVAVGTRNLYEKI